MKRMLLGLVALVAGTLGLAALFAPGGALTLGQQPTGAPLVKTAKVYAQQNANTASINWLVSNIHFNLNNANQTLINSVQFGVTGGTPASVQVTFNTAQNPWYTCSLSGGVWVCPTTSPSQATVQGVTLLGVQIGSNVSSCSAAASGDASGFANALDGSVSILPGDWISGGYDVTVSSSHPAVCVAITNAKVSLPYLCVNGHGSGTITIPIPDQSYTVPSGTATWVPTNDTAAYVGYQAAIQAANLCGGSGAAMANSISEFSATVTWDDAAITPTLRFHYQDPRAKGFGNIDCSDPSANPNSLPACAGAWSKNVQP